MEKLVARRSNPKGLVTRETRATPRVSWQNKGNDSTRREKKVATY